MKTLLGMTLVALLASSCSLVNAFDPCAIPGQCASPEDSYDACHDGFDNDRNGFVDCGDTACAAFCEEVSGTECSDGLDNDQDGLDDCADDDCVHMDLCGEPMFSDEFEGTALNASLWEVFERNPVWIESTVPDYLLVTTPTDPTPDCATPPATSPGSVTVENGELHLRVTPPAFGFGVTRGVVSAEPIDFFEGRLYIRARIRTMENGKHKPVTVALVPDLDPRTALWQCGGCNPSCASPTTGGDPGRFSEGYLSVDVRPLGYANVCTVGGSVGTDSRTSEITNMPETYYKVNMQRSCISDAILGVAPPAVGEDHEVIIAVDAERVVVDLNGVRIMDAENEYGRWPSHLVIFGTEDQVGSPAGAYYWDGWVDSVEVALQRLVSEIPMALVDESFGSGVGDFEGNAAADCSMSGGMLAATWAGEEVAIGPTWCTVPSGLSPGASFDLAFDFEPTFVDCDSNFGLGLFDLNTHFEADRVWLGFGHGQPGPVCSPTGDFVLAAQICSASAGLEIPWYPEGNRYDARLIYDAVRGEGRVTLREANGDVTFVKVLKDATCPELPSLGISSIGATRAGGTATGFIDNVILRELPD